VCRALSRLRLVTDRLATFSSAPDLEAVQGTDQSSFTLQSRPNAVGFVRTGTDVGSSTRSGRADRAGKEQKNEIFEIFVVFVVFVVEFNFFGDGDGNGNGNGHEL
jgi:hypothetical protein